MNRKKIIFFLPLLTSGGAERVSINILNQLKREVYEIHLVLGTLEGDAIHLLPKDITLHHLHSPRTIFSVLKLRKKIQEVQPYAIFSSLNRAHIALALSLIGLAHKPKVIMRVPSSPKLTNKYNEMGKLFKLLLDFSLKKADKIIAQTPEMKEEIQAYHAIKEEKIEILINPLDKASIDKSITEPFDFFDKKYINVLASGRLCVEKGYDILLQAFSHIIKENPNFRLYIIGADYVGELQKYQKIMDELQLQEVVTFLGFQKNPYVFYQHADLFVLSSRREGLPNTVLENLYLQKPIVGTRCIPFMETLINDGENGFLVDVEEVESLAHAILNFKKLTGPKGFNHKIKILEKDIFKFKK